MKEESCNYINARGHILGRLATKIVSYLKQNKQIQVFDAGHILISGNRKDILEKWGMRKSLGTERKGPFYSFLLEKIVKRTVRGMLNKKKTTKLLSKLKIYRSKVPENINPKKEILVPQKAQPYKYIFLKEIEKTHIPLKYEQK